VLNTNCFSIPEVGLHPQDLNDQIASDIEELENLKEKRPFIHSNKQFQKRPFIHNNDQFNYPSKRDDLEDNDLFLSKRPFKHTKVTFGPQGRSKRPFWRLQPILEPEEDEDDVWLDWFSPESRIKRPFVIKGTNSFRDKRPFIMSKPQFAKRGEIVDIE